MAVSYEIDDRVAMNGTIFIRHHSSSFFRSAANIQHLAEDLKILIPTLFLYYSKVGDKYVGWLDLPTK